MGIGSNDDVRKLKFTFDALQQQEPLQGPDGLEEDIKEAVSWAANRSIAEVVVLVI